MQMQLLSQHAKTFLQSKRFCNIRCCHVLARLDRPSWGDGYNGPGTYPNACAKADTLAEERTLPPLSKADRALGLKLEQVSQCLLLLPAIF
jgi:hypothetical protein